MTNKPNIFGKMKEFVIGRAKNLHDPQLFHNISLVAFFAWVGLGSDGLSSCCYGPEEAFLALKTHMFLGIFVAIATALTIFVISSSYSQIIELFPAGGGGYLVASKLLSPAVGMVSGCALLVDYVLTIALSIASGADALFSFLPPSWLQFKLPVALIGILILILLNLRGVKESVLPLVPIFIIFLATHVFVILYSLVVHAPQFGNVVSATISDVNTTRAEIGMFGMFVLIMKAYSMGAGTYTGIEAVSNGIPILREPRVETAKKTMRYMAISLATVAGGLMLGYLLYHVQFQPGKTLNAVLLESVTSQWNPGIGYTFLLITLISEAVLLFVAAQTGFLDGPRVLANMAHDRWFPFQFSLLSERFVTQNGILLMGGAALVLVALSQGSVKFLVVLYAINVFITFCLSQLGMVRHWWSVRKQAPSWFKKMVINGVGLAMTTFILLSVIIIKFNEGGWITIFITGSLILLAISIKRYYKRTMRLLVRLDSLVHAAEIAKSVESPEAGRGAEPKYDSESKTAVILVNGFNGMGLHTLFNVRRLFGDIKNFVFIMAGIIDSGNFKGVDAIAELKAHVQDELDHYVAFMKSQGFYAESLSTIGTETADDISKMAYEIFERYPNSVFFGGQIVLPQDTIFTKMLYNYTTFAVQRRLHQNGIPFIVMPVRVS
ncbi:MAG: APC family permease [Candidatus Omnitrophica bacterium]|nr:APC family permease [Candidatus Omnitrophota bacterium]